MQMFRQSLKVEQVSKDDWKLLSRLDFDHLGEYEITYTVPAGFVTDFASVPWVFRLAIPRYGRYTRSAVLHDCLLKHYDRNFCDNMLLEAMRSEDARAWRRGAIYTAVRGYSGFLYLKKKLLG